MARATGKRLVFYCAFGEPSAMAVEAAQEAALAKAVGWFKEGALDARLPESVKDYLAAAAASFQPDTQAMKLAARKLGPNTRESRNDR